MKTLQDLDTTLQALTTALAEKGNHQRQVCLVAKTGSEQYIHPVFVQPGTPARFRVGVGQALTTQEITNSTITVAHQKGRQGQAYVTARNPLGTLPQSINNSFSQKYRGESTKYAVVMKEDINPT